MRIAPSARTSPTGGSSGPLRWIAAVALSGVGSIAAVKLATPTTLDDGPWAALLFFLLPALLILAVRRISRMLGLLSALAIPFLWLFMSRDSSDSPLLWLAPAAASPLIIFAVTRSSAGARRAVAVAALALGLGALLWPVANRPASGTKLVLIGWDGATWDLIDPLLAEGRMPNLAKLMRGSHRARLRTLPTMLSPRVWSTIATGCVPQVHGILDFAYRQENFKVGRIWDRLKSEGRTFGLCGWYFTWPPSPGVKSADFIVPSHIAPDDQVFPAEYSFYRHLEGLVRNGERKGLRTDLRSYVSAGLQAWRHGIRLSTLRMAAAEVLGRKLTNRGELDNHWRARRVSVSLQADLFAELLRTRSPEFAAVLFTQIDPVSHKYWKYMRPGEFPEVDPDDVEAYGGVIENVYAECDKALGVILPFVPDDADVLLISDHGFQSLHMTDAEKHCRIRTTGLIEALGAEEDLFGTNLGKEVYLRGLAPRTEDRLEVVERIEPVLRRAHFIGEDRPLFEVTREGQLLHLRLASRPALPGDALVALGGTECPGRRILRMRRDASYTGTHKPDGIYVLSGPGAARAVDTDSLNVLDVAPTIAALLHLPISPMWQGRPALNGVSTAELGMAEYPPPSEPRPAPARVDEALKEKLRALGYLE